MDLSMKWINDYVDLKNIDIKQFCHEMTMSGSKVEGYETEGSEISNVVIGKLLSVVPHENSDHLVVCQVEVGKDAPIQIVTGAPNVKAGDIVPVALDGSTLPGGIKIKKGKLRGVESNGMLCSLGELGLTVHDFPYAIEDGIFIIEEDCNIGEDIHEALGLNDTSVEFEITSNRPDCLSVTGLAREASATFNLPLNIPVPSFKGIDGDINEMLKVDIKNTESCKRYCAGIVKNVKIEPSPRWMRERLRASGIRPINNFVDITNYVMLEYGQPMHAFDLRYVKDSHINVRNAVNGEKITTLDGIERELTDEMLVIADSEKPVAVAGVMGGEYSGIMDDTTTVVFESAYFEPVQVRRTSKKLGLRSDASARYEKGVDTLISMTCLNRAFELVEMLGAGEVVKTVIDKDFTDKNLKTVEFSSEWINNFLGTDIPESDMIKYLNSLGFSVENGKVISPNFRIDIEYKADIAEEVARIYGYNNIPSTPFKGVAEAEKAGETLKEYGFNFDKAYTSYLKRAVKTLNCVLDKMNLDWIPVEKSWRLNEKHYGELQGLNKAETAEKYGEEQVLVWRRSYDIAPHPLSESDLRNPRFDYRYHEVPDAELPRTESLKDTIERIMPYWESDIFPSLKTAHTLLVVAHGNSLRGIIKHLKNISDEDIVKLNLPTAVPYVFEFDENLNVANDYFLGNPEEIKKLMEAVANQGKKK